MAMNQATTSFFKNKNGKIVIWQFPNTLLFGWIVFSLLALVVQHGKAHTGLHLLAESFLFAWAYNELRSGESMFRRTLGAIVLVVTALSYFK
jgi:hypothetical protein